MTILYAATKTLTKDLSSNFVVFTYKFLIMLIAFPIAMFRGGIKTKVFHIHFFRGMFSSIGALFMFYALQNLYLTDTTALGYLEQVLLMIIGIIFFGERAAKTKFISIILAVIGALLIIYKDYIYINADGKLTTMDHFPISDLSVYHLFALAAVTVWACNRVLVKLLGRTERSEVQLFYVSFFASIVAFPLAFFKLEPTTLFGFIPAVLPTTFISLEQIGLTQEHMYYFAVLVFCYGLHSVFTFKALQCADVSVIAPFEYTRLVFVAIIGYFFFNEEPLISSYIGCTLILVSGLLMIRNEHNFTKRSTKSEMIKNIPADGA